MSKKHKKNSYQTEYSLSFNWKPNDQIHDTKYLKQDIIDRSSKSPNLSDRKVHQFRHKLKVALLEKLEKLESEFVLNTSGNIDNDDLSSSKHSRKKNSHRKKNLLPALETNELSSISGLNKRSKSKNINSIDRADWQNELRRSRSLAMEFKQKNESTQIWWLTESITDSSSDEWIDEKSKLSPIPFERLSSRMSLIQKLPMRNNINNNILQKIPRKNSLISRKMSTTEPSQSSLSKSSFSCQIAQATGYQSTTDDLSSFNHDTDAKSFDAHITKRRMSNYDVLNNDSKKFNEILMPKLKLPVDNLENDRTSRNNLVFYGPYQTEDFVKDTSSDSNFNSSNNFDTYRLD